MGMRGFSDSLVTLHLTLYEGYVKNTNELQASLDSKTISAMEFGALKRRLGWEFDGMRLHELYFDQLGGNGVVDVKGVLASALAKQFGSLEAWKKDFVSTGLMRGIGWVILYRDPADGKFINAWINEHDTGHLVSNVPILIMDVFEHAYMPQYGLDRAAYITAFFSNLDWKMVENRFK
jgi:Fe-Mn family superoxide dismutase